jgi:glycosyltransferase involved in cell wall biosynthesis
MNEPTYSIILPAYNEAGNIERAIRETADVFGGFGKSFEIIVVDDGSADATPGIVTAISAKLPSVRLLRHEGNCGKGAAVRTGVMNARGGLLLFLDCDLATHPTEAPAFIDKMGEYDIAIGSRRHPDSVIAKPQAWYRIAYGRALNFLIRRLVGLPHHDTQCGFKMFRAAAAKEIFRQLGPARWTFDVEMLLRARANGYKVIELPVTWTNGEMSRVKVGEVISDLWNLVKQKNKLTK